MSRKNHSKTLWMSEHSMNVDSHSHLRHKSTAPVRWAGNTFVILHFRRSSQHCGSSKEKQTVSISTMFKLDEVWLLAHMNKSLADLNWEAGLSPSLHLCTIQLPPAHVRKIEHQPCREEEGEVSARLSSMKWQGVTTEGNTARARVCIGIITETHL